MINVADVSGRNQHPADGEFNEHLWYDFPTVEKLAAQLVTDLSAAAPGQAATFKSNAKAFTAQLGQLQQDEAAIKAKHAGEGVAITEPVPLYLLEAAGLVNKTPEKFSEAIEQDTDVPPAVLKETERPVRHQAGQAARLQPADHRPPDRGRARRREAQQHPRRPGHRDAAARPDLPVVDAGQPSRRIHRADQ